MHKDSGQRVLQLAVGYPAESETAVAVLTLPLGVSLPPGIGLRIDDGPEQRLEIERCEQAGCRAYFAVEGELLASLKRGLTTYVTFHVPPRKPVTLEVSLRGFTAGFNALTR